MTVTIGEQLKTSRTNKNLTQAEVAERLNISRQTLSKWELDKSLPDLQSLKLLAAFYDFSVDDLLEVAQERKKMLEPLTKADLQDELLRFFLNKTKPTEEKITFIQENFVEPLTERPEFFTELYWVFAKKVLLLPGLFSARVPVNSASAKEFIQLLAPYDYFIYWVNQNGLGYFSVLEWLEQGQLHVFPFAEMKAVTFGKAYSVKDAIRNPFAFGYKTTHGKYDAVELHNDKKAAEFLRVLKILDSKGQFFKELQDVTVYKDFRIM